MVMHMTQGSGEGRVMFMHISPMTPPAQAISIGTIALPARGIPPLDMMAGVIVGPVTGWATLEDAISGARALTQPDAVPMVAVLREQGRFVARDVEVNSARPGSGRTNWSHWNLEWVMRQAGPAQIDWLASDSLMAIVDNRAVLRRPGV